MLLIIYGIYAIPNFSCRSTGIVIDKNLGLKTENFIEVFE